MASKTTSIPTPVKKKAATAPAQTAATAPPKTTVTTSGGVNPSVFSNKQVTVNKKVSQADKNRAGAKKIGDAYKKGQKTSPSEIPPVRTGIDPKRLKKDWSGSINQAEYNARQKLFSKVGYIQTAPSIIDQQLGKPGKVKGGGERRISGGGGRRRSGGGGGKMTPLPPSKLHPPKYNSGHGDITGINSSINRTAKQKYENAQKFRRTDPRYKYRRRLWDLKMEKVGLDPWGKPLGSVGARSAIMGRMSQLRDTLGY